MSIGQEGYLRIQKEDSYGTAKTDSMIDLPIKTETLMKAHVAHIENANQLGGRLKQVPNSGREIVNGQIVMDQYPDLMGTIFGLFLGAASSVDNSGIYTHTWLGPDSGDSINRSLTIQQALGSDLAEQYQGCVITGVTLSSDNEANQSMMLNLVGQSVIEDVARAATFSFPAISPYHFGQSSLSISVNGGGPVVQLVNSYELTIDLGYDTERFKLGSTRIQEPTFKAIPTVSLSCSIDADREFLKQARQLAKYALILTTTGAIIGAGPASHQTVIELPGAVLSSETEIPNSNEALSMDLSFDCGFGGITTGSSGAQKMIEVRHIDETPSY